MKSIIFFSLIFTLVGCHRFSHKNPTYAPGPVGNPEQETTSNAKERGGGNAVVCFSSAEAMEKVKKNPHSRTQPEMQSQVESITILDLAEARAPKGTEAKVFSIVEAKPDEKPDQYVSRIVQRFLGNIPLFAQVIEKGQSRFKQLTIQQSQIPISPIQDTGDLRINIDSNCLLMTMMEQRVENGQEVMWVDQWLLDHPKHSQTSRAIAYLHEYIYAEARASFQHTTSRPTRESVGLAILTVGSEDQQSAGKMGLSVFEIQKRLASLGFLRSDSERLWSGDAEVEQFVLDQEILAHSLSENEPPTTAHKQVEEIFRKIALEISKAVNQSQLAGEYRKQIQLLYQAAGMKTEDHPDLDPDFGACRSDVSACTFGLITFGERPLIEKGMISSVPQMTAFEKQRLDMALNIQFSFTPIAHKASLQLREEFEQHFRAELMKIEGVEKSAVEQTLNQINEELQNHLFLHPQTCFIEESNGRLINRGPLQYLTPFYKRAATLISLGKNALLAHPLPIF